MVKDDRKPLLELRDIDISFGFVDALKSATLSIYRQEIVAIVGDNGAGKSTLVKIIAGLLQPDSGTILYRNAPVVIPSIKVADEMGIASVFQGQEFCDNLDVASNLFLGKELTYHGKRDDASMLGKARTVLKSLGSAISVRSPISSLSMGQPVAVARTLLNDPALILLDEPTASLSVIQTAEVLSTIKRLRSEGRSIVMVCHDLPDVFSIADRIIVLRQGHISGIHCVTDTSYEEIIAEIAGVAIKNTHENTPNNTKYQNLIRQRKLISRVICEKIQE